MLITPEHPKVQIDNECWLWIGHCNHNGYAMLSREKKTITGHRWNYRQAKGEIPDDLEVNHLCHRKNCINPDHLNLLTRGANVRYTADLQTTCKAGHPYDKIKVDRGHRSRYCSICQREYNRKYRAAHRDKINQNSRESARRKRVR